MHPECESSPGTHHPIEDGFDRLLKFYKLRRIRRVDLVTGRLEARQGRIGCSRAGSIDSYASSSSSRLLKAHDIGPPSQLASGVMRRCGRHMEHPGEKSENSRSLGTLGKSAALEIEGSKGVEYVSRAHHASEQHECTAHVRVVGVAFGKGSWSHHFLWCIQAQC